MSFAWIVAEAPREAPLDDAVAALGKAELVWVHLDGRDPATAPWLEARGLEPLVIGAMLATETRPRMEGFDDGALINLRGLAAAGVAGDDPLVSIRMWVSGGRAYSVAMRDLAALAPATDAMRRGAIRDPGDLVSTIAGAITAELDPDVAALGDAVDDVEEALDSQRAFTLRRRIAAARGQAIAYRRFLGPQRDALDLLARLTCPWLNDDDRQHLTEAADRAARMAEELEAIRERAALVHEQLTDLRAELLDTRSLILAIAAMIFLPLTFITGLFGMNVQGIPYAEHPHSFWVITGFCVVVAVAVTAYFVWRRWSR